MSDLKSTVVLYRCPSCGATVSSVPGIFTLSGDMFKISCKCKEPPDGALVIKRLPGGKTSLSAPCLLCGTSHNFTLGGGTVDGEHISLPCPITGYDVLFIGEHDGCVASADKTMNEIIADDRLNS